MKKAIFEGLVYDEHERQLPVVYVGDEPNYVADDEGFERHISAEFVDRQVWEHLSAGIEGNEEILSEHTAKMLGQEDIFSIAVIRSQLENRDKQFAQLQETGFPNDMRMYMTMVGFRILVNFRGELQEVIQPGVTNGDEE
ncbi:MAG: hypothetical protein GX603_08335 [Chloroflexi bacterium]|nr:hypothetical protein [Chloroflexota bacterium]